MKLNKNDINVFLTLWIKNDPELWAELRHIEIKILIDRIINEYSFIELAGKYDTTEKNTRIIFRRILDKIDRFISKEVAMHLKMISSKLEYKPQKPFEVFEICLN
ncbi:MAG: hypothetical protein HYR91_04200 [Flavobacteriia bacterium]|nr:hypothetical protein [Flavobacteriia bacterium]